MVRILGAAFIDDNKTEYFISQGKTIASAAKNALNKYKGVQKGLYEYDICDLLQQKFSYHNAEGSWGNEFPEVCFPKASRAEIIKISSELYHKIEQAPEFGELLHTMEGSGGMNCYHPVAVQKAI